MQPFDYIEKLINEHGSAKILRQQLAMAEQQHVTFQREILVLQAQNAELKTENMDLKAKAERLQAELDDARKIIKHYEDGENFIGTYT